MFNELGKGYEEFTAQQNYDRGYFEGQILQLRILKEDHEAKASYYSSAINKVRESFNKVKEAGIKEYQSKCNHKFTMDLRHINQGIECELCLMKEEEWRDEP